MRGVLTTVLVGALCSACASAAPGGAPDDLATAPGPGPIDLASPPHDFAPHDLAGVTDAAGAPADLAMSPQDLGAPCTSCTLTLVGGTIAAVKSDGSGWDSGDLADAYVNLSLSGGASKRSSTKSDVTTVTWNEVMFSGLSQAQLMAGFTVTVKDEDSFNPDDTVASWAVSTTLAQIAAGTITLTSGSGAGKTTTLTLSIH